MLFLLPVLFILERFYFSLADRYRIIDKPNQRSSHSYITRRGGGIIFPAAWLLFFVASGFSLPWFTLGLLLIAVVSFVDDLGEVAVLPRITTHAVALFLALYEFGITSMLPWWGTGLTIFCGIAVLNAVNFMDGINGITAVYALVFWSVLALAAGHGSSTMIFDFNDPLNCIIASLLVFTFYNFRKRALCFAGDVGSVTMAYLMIGAVVPLVFSTTTFGWLPVADSAPETGIEMKYFLLLAVYGIDSFLTILHRLLLRENILKGHRKHLYQFMANEAGMQHLSVSVIYGVLQLGISLWVVTSDVTWGNGMLLLSLMGAVYVGAKWYIMQHVQVRVAPIQPRIADVVEPQRAGSESRDIPVLAAGFDEAVVLPQGDARSNNGSPALTVQNSKKPLHTAEIN
jgi:UDP-N-acetylmuramyl pentapeptide phosphotransferase/UDP-N-acetylglucosamine-1-phosphate transferase